MNLVEKDGSITIDIRVVPRAFRSEVIGEVDGRLKVRIASPPVDGAANAELIRLLAKTFGVAKSGIEIVAGQTSKSKRVRLNGLTSTAVRAVLKGKS
jgi:uncharacterized protein (TIGR00251 family)